MAETKKANMLDFNRSGLPNVSQSKSKFTTCLWSDNCSLFTDYTNLHLSLNMLQLIVSWYITWNALYATWCSAFFLNIGFERWFGKNISAPKLGCVKQALHGFLEFELFKTNPTTIGTCGRLITLLYCISTFAINNYNTLLHHIDLYFIWCNQCPLHTAPQLVGKCLSLEVNLHL